MLVILSMVYSMGEVRKPGLMELENMKGNLRLVFIMEKAPLDGLIKRGTKASFWMAYSMALVPRFFEMGQNMWVSIDMAKKMVAVL